MKGVVETQMRAYALALDASVSRTRRVLASLQKLPESDIAMGSIRGHVESLVDADQYLRSGDWTGLVGTRCIELEFGELEGESEATDALAQFGFGRTLVSFRCGRETNRRLCGRKITTAEVTSTPLGPVLAGYGGWYNGSRPVRDREGLAPGDIPNPDHPLRDLLDKTAGRPMPPGREFATRTTNPALVSRAWWVPVSCGRHETVLWGADVYLHQNDPRDHATRRGTIPTRHCQYVHSDSGNDDRIIIFDYGSGC